MNEADNMSYKVAEPKATHLLMQFKTLLQKDPNVKLINRSFQGEERFMRLDLNGHIIIVTFVASRGLFFLKWNEKKYLISQQAFQIILRVAGKEIVKTEEGMQSLVKMTKRLMNT